MLWCYATLGATNWNCLKKNWKVSVFLTTHQALILPPSPFLSADDGPVTLRSDSRPCPLKRRSTLIGAVILRSDPRAELEPLVRRSWSEDRGTLQNLKSEKERCDRKLREMARRSALAYGFMDGSLPVSRLMASLVVLRSFLAASSDFCRIWIAPDDIFLFRKSVRYVAHYLESFRACALSSQLIDFTFPFQYCQRGGQYAACGNLQTSGGKILSHTKCCCYKLFRYHDFDRISDGGHLLEITSFPVLQLLEHQVHQDGALPQVDSKLTKCNWPSCMHELYCRCGHASWSHTHSPIPSTEKQE